MGVDPGQMGCRLVLGQGGPLRALRKTSGWAAQKENEKWAGVVWLADSAQKPCSKQKRLPNFQTIFFPNCKLI
jgi:hypothetical protein